MVLHVEQVLASSAAGRGETMAGLSMLLFGALLELCSGVSVNRGGYPTFNDEIPFKITWPGAEFTLVSCLLAETVLFLRGKKEKQVTEVFSTFVFTCVASSDRPLLCG